jgi:hypothetical protein
MVNKTKFTSKQADNSWVTHWTSSIPGGPLPSNYEDHELHLFAFPKLLKGDKLLKVAERYTNKQINDKIIAATVGDALEKKIITIAGIANRITTALGQKAKQDGITVAEVTKAFRAARKANGIPIREAKITTAASDGKATLLVVLALPALKDNEEGDDDEDGQQDADDDENGQQDADEEDGHRRPRGVPIREAKVKEAASDGNDTLPVRNDDDDANDDEDGEENADEEYGQENTNEEN